jgi:hypothetical protein
MVYVTLPFCYTLHVFISLFMLSHLVFFFLFYRFCSFLLPSFLSCFSIIYLFFNPYSFLYSTSLLSLFISLTLYFTFYFILWCIILNVVINSRFFPTLIIFYIKLSFCLYFPNYDLLSGAIQNKFWKTCDNPE